MDVKAPDQRLKQILSGTIDHIEQTEEYHREQESNASLTGCMKRMQHMDEERRRWMVATNISFRSCPIKFPEYRVAMTLLFAKADILNFTGRTNRLSVLPIPRDSVAQIMADTQTIIQFPDSNRSISRNLKWHQVVIKGRIDHVHAARQRLRGMMLIRVSVPLPPNSVKSDMPTNREELTNWLQERFLSLSNPDVLITIVPPSLSMVYENSMNALMITGYQSNENLVTETAEKVIELVLQNKAKNDILLRTSFEVPQSHLRYFVGENRKHVSEISNHSGALLHFPRDVEQMPVEISSPVIYMSGQAKSLIKARKLLLAMSPLQLSFDVNNATLREPMEKATEFKELYPSSMVFTRVLPSNYQSLKSLPKDPVIHHMTLTTFEARLNTLYDMIEDMTIAPNSLTLHMPPSDHTELDDLDEFLTLLKPKKTDFDIASIADPVCRMCSEETVDFEFEEDEGCDRSEDFNGFSNDNVVQKTSYVLIANPENEERYRQPHASMSFPQYFIDSRSDWFDPKLSRQSGGRGYQKNWHRNEYRSNNRRYQKFDKCRDLRDNRYMYGGRRIAAGNDSTFANQTAMDDSFSVDTNASNSHGMELSQDSLAQSFPRKQREQLRQQTPKITLHLSASSRSNRSAIKDDERTLLSPMDESQRLTPQELIQRVSKEIARATGSKQHEEINKEVESPTEKSPHDNFVDAATKMQSSTDSDPSSPPTASKDSAQTSVYLEVSTSRRQANMPSTNYRNVTPFCEAVAGMPWSIAYHPPVAIPPDFSQPPPPYPRAIGLYLPSMPMVDMTCVLQQAKCSAQSLNNLKVRQISVADFLNINHESLNIIGITNALDRQKVLDLTHKIQRPRPAA